VKDFNVRLRTIRLWELIIAIIVSFILTGVVENYLGISSPQFEYILFFCFMMVFFLIATYGTTGFNKDVNDLFKASSIIKVLILAISNMCVAIFIQTMLFPLDSLLNVVNSIPLPLLDVVTGTNDPLLFIFEMFSAIIIAPISEELFFRGVLFNRLKIRKGFVFGLVVSSVIFGLCHLNYPDHISHVIYTCIMGMTLCILYSRTDNLLLNMVVHSAYNLLSYLLVYTPLQYLILGGEFSSLMGLILISSLIFIPVYIIYFTYKLK
jgi:membrane protease YdiL (CAAX protease family)